MCLRVRGAEHVHVEAWLPPIIQQSRNEKDAPVIQGQAQLAAVRPDHRILYNPITKLLDGVNDTAKVLYGGDHHARQARRSAHVLNQYPVELVV